MRLLLLAEQQQKTMKNYITNCLSSSLPENTHYHISLEAGFPFTLLSTIMSNTSKGCPKTTVAQKSSFYPLSNQTIYGPSDAWPAQIWLYIPISSCTYFVGGNKISSLPTRPVTVLTLSMTDHQEVGMCFKDSC